MKHAGMKFARLALVAAVGIAAGGCSLLSDYRSMDRSEIRNLDGHVVGQKEVLKARSTGEEVTRIALYKPWKNTDGQIVGYEERTLGGTVIRDLQGNVIGSKWKDLRSRGTNRNGDLAVVVVNPAGFRPGAEAPELATPVASLDFVKLAERL